jgi:integrase
MEKVRPPAVPDVPVPVLSDDDLRRLFKTCEGKSYADRRDIAIMRLFYDTGMRRSELAYLKVRGVRSFRWTEIRPALVILKTDPYCAIRGPRCTVIATTVDHIVPVDDGRR